MYKEVHGPYSRQPACWTPSGSSASPAPLSSVDLQTGVVMSDGTGPRAPQRGPPVALKTLKTTSTSYRHVVSTL